MSDDTKRGGTPEPVERESTGAVAHRAFAAVHSGHVDAETLANELAKHLVERTRRATDDYADQFKARARKTDVQGWMKFALTVVVVILGSWWTLGRLFDERPTVADVEKMMAPGVAADSDIKAVLRDHDQELRQHSLVIVEVNASLKSINTSLAEVKGDVKDLKQRRAPR